MDKQTTLGFVLIALVLLVWIWWSTPQQIPKPPVNPHQEAVQDTAKTEPPVAPKILAPQTETDIEPAMKDSLGKFFANDTKGEAQIFTIETDHYIAEVSSKGAVILKWELKDFKTWDGYPVQLVNQKHDGDFSLLFTTTDGKLIDTHDLYFTAMSPPRGKIVLSGSDSISLVFVLNAGQGRIIKTLRFKNDKYDFDASVTLENMASVIANYEYQVIWEHGLKYTERNSVDESRNSLAYSYAGGEITDIDASKAGETPVSNTSGTTDWVATKIKYFAAVIISSDKKASGAYMEGRHETAPNNGVVKQYSIGLKVPFRGEEKETSNFKVFLGPLDFDIVKSYGDGLDHLLSLGWAWLRPLNVYIFIPLFEFLHLFIANWGVVIIVFSLIIKAVLHPLTRSSMKSMRKMQALQPKMEELRTKYKDEPTKMNEQTMRLYKEYGVNPAGGCLPFLLQMPILYALYSIFLSSIKLRQADFIWWIKDLSVPDVIFTLPFTIPIFGVREVSGLALFMGVTMFFQQKMTVKDPRQKAMVWMMPVMMTLLFNSFPSGLNLYYFVFNLLAIVQQLFVNKQHEDEPLQKVSGKKGKGGLMAALSKNIPERPKR
jgi:YidC/Oxa1 family membrane protein insertase